MAFQIRGFLGLLAFVLSLGGPLAIADNSTIGVVGSVGRVVSFDNVPARTSTLEIVAAASRESLFAVAWEIHHDDIVGLESQRDGNLPKSLSREEFVAYLREHGVTADWHDDVLHLRSRSIWKDGGDLLVAPMRMRRIAGRVSTIESHLCVAFFQGAGVLGSAERTLNPERAFALEFQDGATVREGMLMYSRNCWANWTVYCGAKMGDEGERRRNLSLKFSPAAERPVERFHDVAIEFAMSIGEQHAREVAIKHAGNLASNDIEERGRAVSHFVMSGAKPVVVSMFRLAPLDVRLVALEQNGLDLFGIGDVVLLYEMAVGLASSDEGGLAGEKSRTAIIEAYARRTAKLMGVVRGIRPNGARLDNPERVDRWWQDAVLGARPTRAMRDNKEQMRAFTAMQEYFARRSGKSSGLSLLDH